MIDEPTATSRAKTENEFIVRLPEGAEFGPLAITEVRSLVKRGAIPQTAFLRRTTSSHWYLVSDLAGRDERQTNTTPTMRPAEELATSASPPLVAPPVPTIASGMQGPAEQLAHSPQCASSPSPPSQRQPRSSVLGDTLGVFVSLVVGGIVIAGMIGLKQQTGFSFNSLKLFLKILCFVVVVIGGGLWALVKFAQPRG